MNIWLDLTGVLSLKIGFTNQISGMDTSTVVQLFVSFLLRDDEEIGLGLKTH